MFGNEAFIACEWNLISSNGSIFADVGAYVIRPYTVLFRCGMSGRLYVGYSHDVGKHSGGGDFLSCAVALDDHGVAIVSFCGEQHYVVRVSQFVERV